MCICKASKVITTSGNLAAILDFWHMSTSHETGGITIRKFDPENISVTVGILSVYAQELDICPAVFLPPSPGTSDKSRKKVAGRRFKTTICFAYSFRIHTHKLLLTTDKKVVICLCIWTVKLEAYIGSVGATWGEGCFLALRGMDAPG